MKVALCIENELKLQVLQQATRTVFGDTCTCTSINVERPRSEVFGRDAHREQLQDIITAAQQKDANADIYVCMLGGMEEQFDGLYEIAGVAVQTKDGATSFSSCASFKVPPAVAEKVTKGTPFAQAISDLFQPGESPEDGFISLLTHGAVTKRDQYLQATIVALSGILQESLMHHPASKFV